MKKFLRMFTPHRFEVEQHYDDVEKQVDKYKQAKKASKNVLIEKNEQLQKTIVENHFTIRIHKATRGATR